MLHALSRDMKPTRKRTFVVVDQLRLLPTAVRESERITYSCLLFGDITAPKLEDLTTIARLKCGLEDTNIMIKWISRKKVSVNCH